MVETIPKKTLAAMKANTTGLAASLEDVRLRIVAALDEQARLERLPVDETEAPRRLREWTGQVREEAFTRIGEARFAGVAYRPLGAVETVDLFLAVLAPSVETEIGARLGSYCQAAGGISAADRAAKLRDLTLILLELERTEEALIRSAEAANIAILRRADADPRAVLASDQDLP